MLNKSGSETGTGTAINHNVSKKLDMTRNIFFNNKIKHSIEHRYPMTQNFKSISKFRNCHTANSGLKNHQIIFLENVQNLDEGVEAPFLNTEIKHYGYVDNMTVHISAPSWEHCKESQCFRSGSRSELDPGFNKAPWIRIQAGQNCPLERK